MFSKKSIAKILSLFTLASAAAVSPIQARTMNDYATKQDLLNCYYTEHLNYVSAEEAHANLANITFTQDLNSDAEKLAMYTGLFDSPATTDFSEPLTRGDLMYHLGKTQLNPSLETLDTTTAVLFDLKPDYAAITDLSLVSPEKREIVNNIARREGSAAFPMDTGVVRVTTDSITIGVNKPVTVAEVNKAVSTMFKNYQFEGSSTPRFLIKGYLIECNGVKYTIGTNTVKAVSADSTAVSNCYRLLDRVFMPSDSKYLPVAAQSNYYDESYKEADINMVPMFLGAAWHVSAKHVEKALAGDTWDYVVGDNACHVYINPGDCLSKYVFDYTKPPITLSEMEFAFGRPYGGYHFNPENPTVIDWAK